MPARLPALVLLLCASPAWAAELRTLKGEGQAGDVVRVTDKEIVIARGGEQVARRWPRSCNSTSTPPTPSPPAEFTDVELTDGSLLHCKAVAVKGKQSS